MLRLSVTIALGVIASAGFGMGLFLYLFLIASHARPSLEILRLNAPSFPEMFLVMGAIGIVVSGWFLIPVAVLGEQRFRQRVERMRPRGFRWAFLVPAMALASYMVGVSLGFLGGALGLRIPVT
jgi:hypothetical protein